MATNSPAGDAQNIEQSVFALSARTETANSGDMINRFGAGVLLTLDITAVGGTPTLDVKVQVKDTISGKYTDLPNAAFAQKTGTGTSILIIRPGLTASANAVVNSILPRVWRAVATIGGGSPSLTFSLGAAYLP